MITKPITLTNAQYNHCSALRLEYAQKLNDKYQAPADAKRNLKLQNKLSQWNQMAIRRLPSNTLTIVERTTEDVGLIK